MSKEKCTNKMIDHICELKAKGFKDKDICECVGIHQSTYCNWKNKPTTNQHLKLIERLKKAEEQHRIALVSKIEKAADADWRAGAWLLERTYPESYAKPEVQLANKIAEDAADKTIERMADVLVKIRETAENA